MDDEHQTNGAAAAALETLSKIGSGLQKTQAQVSTGLRVQKSSDNAAYWAVATTMRSDVGAIGAVSDDLALSHSVIDTQYQAATSIVDALTKP